MLMTTIFYHVDNFCNDLEKSATILTYKASVNKVVLLQYFFLHFGVRLL